MRQVLPLVILATSSALLGAACQRTLEPRPDIAKPVASTVATASGSTPPKVIPKQQTATLEKHMEEHFSKAAEMKGALVRGDQDSALKAAAWLAEDEWTPRLRPDWRPYMQAMQTAAGSARDAGTRAQIAQALGRIARACANCHEATKIPDLAIPEPPTEKSDATPPTALHAWAAERMWEGLVVASEDAWTRGAHVLAGASLERSVPSAGTKAPEMLAHKVHELARAAETTAPQQRPVVYAELLVTCFDCHRDLGVKTP